VCFIFWGSLQLAQEFERAYVDSPFETFVGTYKASFEDNRPYEKRLLPFYEDVYRNLSAASDTASTSPTSLVAAISANDPTYSLLPAKFARIATQASMRAKANGEDPVAAAAAAVAAAEAATSAAANSPGKGPRLDWSQISWSLSISRAVAMMQQHEQEVNVTYDRIILVRPDGTPLLQWLPIFVTDCLLGFFYVPIEMLS